MSWLRLPQTCIRLLSSRVRCWISTLSILGLIGIHPSCAEINISGARVCRGELGKLCKAGRECHEGRHGHDKQPISRLQLCLAQAHHSWLASGPSQSCIHCTSRAR